jgi:hypothetical protein
MGILFDPLPTRDWNSGVLYAAMPTVIRIDEDLVFESRIKEC